MTVDTLTARPPSIRQIASEANVAPSTVSRAFNANSGKSSISAKTREKIEAVCAKYNYQPNIHATRLFANRSNAIALVVPETGDVLPKSANFADPNLARTLAGLESAASENGQDLVLLSADENFHTNKRYLSILRSKAVDGMIVWGARPKDEEFIEQVINDRWPLVIANGRKSPGAISVQADNRQGGAEMAKVLISLGHKNIAYIAGSSNSQPAAERKAGFKEICRSSDGVNLEILQGSFSFESGKQLADQLLNSPKCPTAIAAVSDLTALGVIEAVQEHGLEVGREISVTGGDAVFPYYKPALTTFCAPMEEIGRQALSLLLKRIEGGAGFVCEDSIVPVDIKFGQTAGKCPTPRNTTSRPPMANKGSQTSTNQ